VELHCLRDLTRGGLATTLIEIAEAAKLGLELDELAIPVLDEVRGACEILGFDPFYVANEGRFAAIVAEQDAGRALEILRTHAPGLPPQIIGEVKTEDAGRLILKSQLGTKRILDMLSGEQLPRIC
jgi:hydrogenase expression/formation protein HypE